jgi:hypothetical protein
MRYERYVSESERDFEIACGIQTMHPTVIRQFANLPEDSTKRRAARIVLRYWAEKAKQP